MKNIEEIQIIMKRMSQLLFSGGLDEWASEMSGLAILADKGCADFRSKIRRMYGGMGSLNDIVLYKNGNVLMQENEEFDKLKERLYELTRFI